MASSVTRKHACGLVLVALVVLLWVTSSTLIQFILREESFERPFFLTYYSTTLFTAFLLPNIPLLWRAFRSRHQASYARLELTSPAGGAADASNDEADVEALANEKAAPRPLGTGARRSLSIASTSTVGIDEADLAAIDNDSLEVQASLEGGVAGASADRAASSAPQQTDGEPATARAICCGGDSESRLSVSETAKLALLFSPIWFVMNYTFNTSLLLTSVSSNTILSTTSGPFTLALCYLWLRERFSWRNALGTVLVMLGVVFITIQDTTRATGTRAESLSGDALALFSALLYALYGTLMKRKIGDDQQMHMTLFFGFVGLINCAIMWPMILVLGSLGAESLTPPPTSSVLAYLTLNGFVGVCSDYLWARAVLLTTPLIATIGLSLTIPFAFISDSLVQHKTYGVMYFLGSIAVFVGFFLVNLTYKKQLEQSEAHEHVQRQQIESIVEEFDLPESDADNPAGEEALESADEAAASSLSRSRSRSDSRRSRSRSRSPSRREETAKNGSTPIAAQPVSNAKFTIN